MTKLKTVKRGDGWWITGLPQDHEDHGPYRSKADAQEDKAGLERTLKNWNNPTFWTGEISA